MGLRQLNLTMIAWIVLVMISVARHPFASANEVDLSPAPKMRASVLPNHKMIIELCESNDPKDCTPYGDPEGYTETQWKRIQKICDTLGYFGSASDGIFATGLTGATATGNLYIIAPTIAATALAHEVIRDPQELKTAGDLLPGFNGEAGSTPFRYKIFKSLDSGLERCTGLYSLPKRIYTDIGCSQYRYFQSLENPAFQALLPLN